jgi:hypothetical protein
MDAHGLKIQGGGVKKERERKREREREREREKETIVTDHALLLY